MVLICDELLGGLDYLRQPRVLRMLKRLQKAPPKPETRNPEYVIKIRRQAWPCDLDKWSSLS